VPQTRPHRSLRRLIPGQANPATPARLAAHRGRECCAAGAPATDSRREDAGTFRGPPRMLCGGRSGAELTGRQMCAHFTICAKRPAAYEHGDRRRGNSKVKRRTPNRWQGRSAHIGGIATFRQWTCRDAPTDVSGVSRQESAGRPAGGAKAWALDHCTSGARFSRSHRRTHPRTILRGPRALNAGRERCRLGLRSGLPWFIQERSATMRIG
jgi:hypothetical protein